MSPSFISMPEILAPASCADAARRSPWLPVTISIRLSRGTFQRLFRLTVGGKSGQHARLRRRPDHPLHRPAQKTDRPARRAARLGQRLQPRDVRGEGGGHHHARARPASAPVDLGPSVLPTGPHAAKKTLVRIAHQRLARRRSPRSRGKAPRRRPRPPPGVRSILKSAECTIRPAGVSMHQHRAFRDRMARPARTAP